MGNKCACGGTGYFKIISEEVQVITCDTCGHKVESNRTVPVWENWIAEQVERNYDKFNG